ncbi:winged helix DNA-binding domain-containing protein [Kineosporia rhizophila]|uniref:winged helix DNA-binding domain-containing protein n=1 Tax=Kineosporia TaxID=49184 RepID=UPI001E557D38|nr:winged helix DNA-binding domain-containing protein [Kineosporia sp. NBRC 101677]MCE0536012.1 winged helix DNA-binding domain-containing protein [Kineosporia rhizophila]GLY14152.1 hypothetical protein Kisp01_11680 [Kineosporia sp. NBRC 101677]
MQITAAQVLAWRLKRQFLSPRTSADVEEVVARLCGVQMQVTSAAHTTIASRQKKPDTSGVATGLERGSLIKTWAMRGTLHLCRADRVAGCLALVAEARSWTKPSWQKTFGASPADIDRLTEAVGEILQGTALTREELVTELLRHKEFKKIEDELRSGWGALLKPLAWRGALCHGETRGNRITFTTPSTVVPEWPGLPTAEAAAPDVISSYLSAYGPATPETFDAWLTRGVSKKPALRSWFASLREELTEVEVDGQKALIRSEHVDELAATKPSRDVHLLGPFDAYVLGAGTKDVWMLPSEHRALVSKAAGWIAPVILSGGRIVGTWELENGDVSTDFFPGEKALPSKAWSAEVRRATPRGPS